MALHFEPEEFASRRSALLASIESSGLDGLLMFRQESMYYLTGYDTFGFCFFQCLYLHGDGRMTLLTRAPDLRQAQATSNIEDIRIWVDEAGKNPAQDLRAILAEYGAEGSKVGIELDAYGLTAFNGKQVESVLAGFCTLDDASYLVSDLRLHKSEAEMVYVRRAAELADDALEAAIELAHPGAFEGDILAAMQGAVFKGGGDYPGNGFIIGSGDDALLCRYFTGRRHLSDVDQLTVELAGAYRQYHACLMRTILIGQAHEQHRSMHSAACDAMAACLEAIRPGHTMGDVFDAHARIMDAAGFREHRLNACGYSLGATYQPTWMDGPMFHAGNSTPIESGMVLFAHMILMNSDDNRAMTLGQTVLVTDDGHERLSRLPLDLIIN